MIGRRLVALLASFILVSGAVSCGRRPVDPPVTPEPSGGRVTGSGYVASIRPPTEGALFGAYVDPREYREHQRVSAFVDFENRLGRRLAIYHNYHPWTDPFPSHSDRYFADRGTTLLLSWAGTDTLTITSGRDDAMIRKRAEALAELNRPVLLRWRWEMNRPNLAAQIHSGPDYVAAWRHIHDIFTEVGADDVGWVWCPLSAAQADSDYGSYYPGDQYVDWICSDGYSNSAADSFDDVFKPFLGWAATIDKPVLIGEFGRTQGAAGSRAAWLLAARRSIERTPQIKGVLYFESPQGVSGNYSLIDEPDAIAAMRAWANDPYFNPG
jgi:hypothetical protein